MRHIDSTVDGEEPVEVDNLCCHYLQGFCVDLRWCRICFINNMYHTLVISAFPNLNFPQKLDEVLVGQKYHS